LGAGGRTVITAEALRHATRNSGDYAIRNLADATVMPVSDVEIATSVHHYAEGEAQLSTDGGAIIATETERSGPVTVLIV
jgi:hypothetical protein